MKKVLISQLNVLSKEVTGLNSYEKIDSICGKCHCTEEAMEAGEQSAQFNPVQDSLFVDSKSNIPNKHVRKWIFKRNENK